MEVNMPHGHPDNYPDRSNEPNRRAFGRPTPRIDALINNSLNLSRFGSNILNTTPNAGSQITSTHRKARSAMFRLLGSLPTVAHLPDDERSNNIREDYADSLSRITGMYDSSSFIINSSVADRHKIRADAKKMAEEKFEWPDE